MRGFDQVKSKMQALPTKVEEAGASAVREVGKKIFDGSQSQVPVDTGALKSSASMDETGRGSDITITIGYDTEYALFVHEDLGKGHVNGNAKYLENPFNQHAPTINDVVQSKLGRLV